MKRKVTVYRLWPDGHWDTAEVEVDTRQPLTFETVEVRAVKAAWFAAGLAGIEAADKPRQIGLYMPDHPAGELPT